MMTPEGFSAFLDAELAKATPQPTECTPKVNSSPRFR
jgi:hypothetical protein